jgi:hypothetical protein
MIDLLIKVGDKVSLNRNNIHIDKTFIRRGSIGEVVQIDSDNKKYCVDFHDHWEPGFIHAIWLKFHEVQFHSPGTPKQKSIEKKGPPSLKEGPIAALKYILFGK